MIWYTWCAIQLDKVDWLVYDLNYSTQKQLLDTLMLQATQRSCVKVTNLRMLLHKPIRSAYYLQRYKGPVLQYKTALPTILPPVRQWQVEISSICLDMSEAISTNHFQCHVNTLYTFLALTPLSTQTSNRALCHVTVASNRLNFCRSTFVLLNPPSQTHF